MARFFLQIRTPRGLIPDPEGVEIARLCSLRECMKKIAGDLVREDASAITWEFELRDEVGRKVLAERFERFV